MPSTRLLLAAFGLLLLFAVHDGRAAESPQESKRGAADVALDLEIESAPVIVDGRRLLVVAGVADALPASARARRIAGRIEALGDGPAFDATALKVEPVGADRVLRYGGTTVMVVSEVDARLVGVGAEQLATVYRQRIVEAVEQYRAERAGDFLQWAAVRVAAALGAALAIGAAGYLVARLLRRIVEARYRSRVKTVGIQSFEIVRAERIWAVWDGALRGLRTLLFAGLTLVFLDYALAQFPWTRRFALGAATLVLDPLREMGAHVAAAIPNLVFLTVLVFLVRYGLRVLRLFLLAVGRGRVSLRNFEPEWAEPTYKLLRLLAVALALVVAYPYIPGSGSEAFKAISLFIGVVFSIGSTTAIANMIAGYVLVYRRAFRVGDRIRVGDVYGDVMELRLQVTHLRTPANEEVIVPNLTLLNQQIVNYSTLAKGEGVAIRVKAGIGYDTPWRQVEAMLLLAARRTPAVLESPAPFVLHDGLGDFAVNYELYAFVRDANRMLALHAELSRNVLDVFNEHGVQIMTPNYRGDTAEPKIVKPQDWYLPPAQPPAAGATRAS